MCFTISSKDLDGFIENRMLIFQDKTSMVESMMKCVNEENKEFIRCGRAIFVLEGYN